jgi:hypothetical protein
MPVFTGIEGPLGRRRRTVVMPTDAHSVPSVSYSTLALPVPTRPTPMDGHLTRRSGPVRVQHSVPVTNGSHLRHEHRQTPTARHRVAHGRPL